jgi:hypothetical protein
VQILVIALQTDLHADSVIYHLNKKGVEVFRIDPTLDDDIPEKVSIISGSTFEAYYEIKNKKRINPLEIKGIFCRFALDSLIATSEDPLVNFSSSEALCAFLAPLRMIETSYWINDPWIENRADCKLLQSNIARKIGLKTPEFIVSSDYSDLLTFYNKYKDVIIKPLSDTALVFVNGKFEKPENLYSDDFYAPYTTKFSPIKDCDKENIDHTPALLQREIKKKSDIRVTIIDDKIFAVEMPYKEGSPIDFRLNEYNGINEYDLSDEIKDKLFRLVKTLGLRFSSCDLILDKENQIYFIESNVQGNWLWTEISTNLNISETIANALINGIKNDV